MSWFTTALGLGAMGLTLAKEFVDSKEADRKNKEMLEEMVNDEMNKRFGKKPEEEEES